jgi:hypothetical protein
MIKTLSVALAAVFVFGAVAAASASASQPKAELESGTFPVSFTGAGGAGTLEVLPTPKRTVSCTGNKSSGEIASATTVKKAKVIFTGCTATGPFGIKVNCTSSGAATGEIVSNLLEGSLQYIALHELEIAGKKVKTNVGIDLKPESPNTEFAKFVCGGVQEMKVTGSVIGMLTEINGAFGTSFTLTFLQTEGHQLPETFFATSGCAATTDVLSTTGTSLGFGGETFAAKQSGVEGTETLTTPKMKVVASSCV